MLKKIVLAAALASGVAVTAVPAVAQTVYVPGNNSYVEGTVVDRVVQPDGSMIVTRRFVQPTGETVDVTRTYQMAWNAVPATGHYEGTRGCCGGIGGAIGGYYINGTTPENNKPLPPSMAQLPTSYWWGMPVITVHEPG